jgi:AraC family transcriptional regulator, regulatory protein of adaptative response / DNA-3-methyladenine glycosylase II
MPLEATALQAVRLSYRAPFDWSGVIRFLQARMLKGVEWVEEDGYLRTARLGAHSGWIHVRHAPKRRGLVVEPSSSLTPVLPALLETLRHLFDLGARPGVIAAQLVRDRRLAKAVARAPGLRVPGAFDGFELAIRAVLGQQVTVKAATTLAGRFAEAFGEPIETPHRQLTRLSPTAQRVATATVEELAKLGIVRARARSIIVLAEEIAAGRLKLEPGAPYQRTIEQLIALPGIGRWTADYIAMRALRWADALPHGDIALRNSLGGVTAARAEVLSQAWRPWRSYATLHLWQAISRSSETARPAPASGRRKAPRGSAKSGARPSEAT